LSTRVLEVVGSALVGTASFNCALKALLSTVAWSGSWGPCRRRRSHGGRSGVSVRMSEAGAMRASLFEAGAGSQEQCERAGMLGAEGMLIRKILLFWAPNPPAGSLKFIGMFFVRLI